MKKLTFYCFLAATLGLLVKGASSTGSLGGEVTDPSGALVPHARVVVSSAHWSKSLSTNDAGQYVIGDLAPGKYKVSVTSNGLAPFDRAGLVVSAGDRSEMDATLDLPVLKQAITVAADASPAAFSLKDEAATLDDGK